MAAVVHVAGIEHPGSLSVQVCAEEVVVVGVLFPVISGGGEEYLACLLIHALDSRYVVCSVGQRAYQFPVLVVQIELCPAVALGAHDNLAGVLHQLEVTYVDVGVKTLFYQYLHGVGVQPVTADVHSVLVAADAGEIERFVVTQPYRCQVVAVEVLVGPGPGADHYGLVLEGPYVQGPGSLALHVEQHQVALGAGLSGHLIFVGLEFRTGIGGGIDHPHLAYAGHIVFLMQETPGVRRPLEHDVVPVVGVPVLHASVIVASVGHIFRAVSSEGMLYHS